MRRALALSVLLAPAAVLPFMACGGSSNTNGTDGGPSSSSSGGQSTSSSGSSSGAGSSSGSSSGGQSSSSSGSSSGGTSGDSGFVPASHIPFPQIVDQGLGIITAPVAVTVTFQGDSMASQLEDFGKNLASSSWWNTIDQGYCSSSSTCIGDGPTGVSVEIPTAAAASYTDAQIQTWLATEISNGTLPMPAAGSISPSVYLLYFPASTTVSFDGGESCNDFLGYHGSTTIGSQQVAYAVNNECDFGSMTLEETTITASHELIEASTDPVSTDTASGFYLNLDDPNTWAWNDVQGGEVADMCVDIYGLGEDTVSDGSYYVQRIWSNALAMAGGDPCNPAMAKPYFNVAPSQMVYVLDVGGSVTFEASAFSNQTVPDWELLALDFSGGSSPYLQFTIEGGTESDAGGPLITVNNGQTPKVTMTLLSDPGGAPNLEADGALLSVTGDPNNPTYDQFWPFIVLSPADAMDAGIDATVSTHGTKRGRMFHSGPARLAPGHRSLADLARQARRHVR